MRTIWKYTIHPSSDVTTHDIPHGAVLRHVSMIDGEVGMWMEVDPHPEKADRRAFRLFATGQEIPDGWEYRGTVLVHLPVAMRPTLVFHIHEATQ